MASLFILTGEQAGKQFVLANRPLSIGREPGRDIQVVDPKVSRKHAIVRHEGETFYIAPSKALNGIIINGTKIEAETALKDGDEIVVGDTMLQFTLSSDPAASNAVFGRKVAGRDVRDKNTLI